MPLGLGLPELALILVLVIMLFGVGRLPEVGKSLGKTIRDFKVAVNDKSEDTNSL